MLAVGGHRIRHITLYLDHLTCDTQPRLISAFLDAVKHAYWNRLCQTSVTSFHLILDGPFNIASQTRLVNDVIPRPESISLTPVPGSLISLTLPSLTPTADTDKNGRFFLPESQSHTTMCCICDRPLNRFLVRTWKWRRCHLCHCHIAPCYQCAYDATAQGHKHLPVWTCRACLVNAPRLRRRVTT